jgi:hypothetical protein
MGTEIVDDALKERGAREAAGSSGQARGERGSADPDWERFARTASRRAGYAQALATADARDRADAAAERKRRA